MIPRLLKPVAATLILSVVTYQPFAYAGPTPSKTASNQTLDARAGEVGLARTLYGTDSIERALAAEGLTPDLIQTRVAALSTADVVSLSRNPARIRSAGVSMTKKAWTIAGIAAGAVVLGGLAVTQQDDGEDEDGPEDD